MYNATLFRHRNKMVACRRWCFSTSPNQKTTFSVPLISPFCLKSKSPDPPADVLATIMEVPKKPKFMSHESAISMMKHENDPMHALEIFHTVSRQKGFNHNSSIFAVILHKLARFKKFQAVDVILHQMTYETCKFHEGIFLNLMTFFSNSSLHERVLDTFFLIQPIVREKPSLKAISTCLNLLIESNQVELAREFLLNVKKNLNVGPNTCIFNILVKHQCKNGDLESAFELVKEMKKSNLSYPNLITYSTLMDGLCETGRLHEAIDLFEEMVSKDQIVPDQMTYSILINGFCKCGKVDRARKIFEFMKKNGCTPNIVNYSCLMKGFCKEGRLEDAKEILNETNRIGLKQDRVLYTTLINCLCRASKVQEAMDLLEEMGEKGCKADAITYNIILGGLCREGRSTEALTMLERLANGDVYLNKGSYRIVLNFLCNEGKLEKATELLLGIMLGRGFVPHFATSNELLVRLCWAGRASDAAMVLYGLVEMGFNPECEAWSQLIELMCRERRALAMFDLVDRLTKR